jgi:pyruvate dehydrogenase E2 component (dihydrolipoamide acetyltransferase)
MAEPIVLPKMGLTMEEGTVREWFVAAGEAVTAGQIVVEIETYKANLEVESPADGVLRAALDVGATVPVGTIIGIVGTPDEVLEHELGTIMPGVVSDAGGAPPAPPASASPQRSPRRSDAPERAVSPAARARARELGLDVGTIEGTGPGGRVRVEDVERAAEKTDR